MILVLEVGMFVVGLIGLIIGKLYISSNTAVYGLPARLIGIIGMLPAPLSFLAGMVIGIFTVAQGKPMPEPWVLIVSELVITGICALAFFGLASMYKEDIAAYDRKVRKRKKRMRRLEEGLDDDYSEDDFTKDDFEDETPAPRQTSIEIIQCPHCQARLKAKSGSAGRRITCPQCKHVFMSPSSAAQGGFMTASAPRARSPQASESRPGKRREWLDDEDDEDEEEETQRRPRMGVCPKCGEAAPMVRVPKNWRQALWGGNTCADCGCEYDKWGRRIRKNARASAESSSAGLWIWVAVASLIVGVTLGGTLWYVFKPSPKIVIAQAPVHAPFVVPPIAPLPDVPAPPPLKIEIPKPPPPVVVIQPPAFPVPKKAKQPVDLPLLKGGPFKLKFAPGTDEAKFAKYDTLPLKQTQLLKRTIVPTGPFRADSELWTTLGRKIMDSSWTKSDLYRPEGPGETFENHIAEAGFLIGVKCKKTQVITSLAAVYQTQTGTKMVDVFGPQERLTTTVMAPQGYAIGAINMRVDDYVRGISLIFMKVTETGLDPDDAFRWSLIPSPSRGDAVCVDSDGAFIVGLHGRADLDAPNTGTGLSALGIVTAK